MKPGFRILCLLFVLAFGFSLYLLACTISINSSYQPTIERIGWLHPFPVALLFFVAARFLTNSRRDLRVFLLLGLAECALVFLVVLVGDLVAPQFPIPPAPRTLLSTIDFSLTHPQFSNRSYGVPVWSALLLTIFWRLFPCHSRDEEKT